MVVFLDEWHVSVEVPADTPDENAEAIRAIISLKLESAVAELRTVFDHHGIGVTIQLGQ